MHYRQGHNTKHQTCHALFQVLAISAGCDAHKTSEE
jgi:hypothetical protein